MTYLTRQQMIELDRTKPWLGFSRIIARPSSETAGPGHKPANFRQPWSKADDAALTEMWANSKTVAEIVEALGRTYHSVTDRCWRLGLPSRGAAKGVEG